MSATIRDVAQRAGVGLGTVSRVLNNSPLVSAATRQRVLEVIAELQYKPNHVARSLSLGKTLTISTIAPFFTRPSVVERLRGIETMLATSAYDLIVHNIENIERRNVCLVDVPRRERSDGVLIISLSPHADEVATIQHAGIPVILVDTYAPTMHSVVVDDRMGGYIATRHLTDLGHKHIGFVGDSPDTPFNFTSNRERLAGYRQALADCGIAVQPAYERLGLHGRFEARLMAQSLLSEGEPPTAIFAASDTQALGVLEAARDASLQIPADLSVIGYDDIEIAEYLNLTTIRQPLFESGVRGITLLLELLDSNGEAYPSPIYERLPVELIVRGTTAPPPSR